MTSILPAELLPPEKLSWRQVASRLPSNERDELLKAFQSEELSALFEDWVLDARREQLPPPGDWWYVWLIMAGRGFGKTYAGAHWLIEMHQNELAENSAIVAATSGDLRRFCLDGPSGIMTLAPPHFYPRLISNELKLRWPNDTVTNLYTSEKPDRLRGPNHDAAWCDELTYWKYPDQVWDMLNMTMRLGDCPRIMITMTPRPIKIVKDLLTREGKDVVITRGTTYENLANLSPTFKDHVVAKYEGTRLGRQELRGEALFDVEGALWDHEMLDTLRCDDEEVPKTSRTVVAVDPSTTGGENADEAGIIVASLAEATRHAYVEADYSLRGSPETWAKKAVRAYTHHDANLIVAEKNQGGEMVRNVIHNIDQTIPVKLVHASKGKVARAEPVSMLYEQGRVHHVGIFPQLEDEMTTFVPGEVDKNASPNRVDALVWGITELLVGKRGRVRAWGRKRREKTARELAA